MEPQQWTNDQVLAWHAERQTSAIETIRNYVFYLLLLAVVGVIVGVLAALGGRF